MGHAAKYLINKKSYLKAIAVFLIIIISLCIRMMTVKSSGEIEGYRVMETIYMNIGINILEGNGYVTSLSQGALVRQRATGYLLPFEEIEISHSDMQRPNLYFTPPGYPYLLAFIWRITGRHSYGVVMFFQALLDAIVGPLLLYILLRISGFDIAGFIAAALYAISLPLTHNSVMLLPDAFSPIFSLLIIAPLLIYGHYQRPILGAALSGLMLGIAGLFRGEYLLFLIFLTLGILVTKKLQFRIRCRMAMALLLGWLFISAFLTSFYIKTYNRPMITRPALGIGLWEGVKSLPRGASDDAAVNLLKRHTLQYGTLEGDNFLLKEAIKEIKERPVYFISLVMRKAGIAFAESLYLSLAPFFKILADPLKPIIRSLLFLLRYYLLFILCAVLIIGVRKARPVYLLVMTLYALWSSRMVHVAFTLYQPRFMLPMIIVYFIFFSVFIEALVEKVKPRP